MRDIFLSGTHNKQTDRQTDRQTDYKQTMHDREPRPLAEIELTRSVDYMLNEKKLTIIITCK